MLATSGAGGAIDSPIPFVFHKELDRNVFKTPTGVGSGQTAWNIQKVTLQQRPNPYCQDLSRSTQVYYLLGVFKPNYGALETKARHRRRAEMALRV